MPADILLVDLDAFYASVERRRRPELAGRPLIVGWPGPRGVVLSGSYEARADGVRNGMPGARARRLCPDAAFVAPDFEAYVAASAAFREVLDSITPTVEPLSLDEAFLDVHGAHRLYGSSERIAEIVRERVREALGLACSVGGGPSKLVAKIASRAAKPDGALVVEDALAFLRPLPLEELWGVGAATAAALRRIGLKTIGDLADAPAGVLRSAVGESLGTMLSDLARGDDPRTVETDLGAKSVGAEETFDEDIASDELVRAELLRLSDRVAARLHEAGLHARTITVKVRLQSFTNRTRSKTLREPTNDLWTIHRTACEAYARIGRGRERVRLVGVSASGLLAGVAPRQLTLEAGPDLERAEDAVVRARTRFGSDAVRPARLMEGPDG